MVLRMMADVVALKPDLVHLMGGTNDIAGNTEPVTVRQTIDNLTAMIVLAKARRTGVVRPDSAGLPTPRQFASTPARRLRMMSSASAMIRSISSWQVGISWIRPATMPQLQAPASMSP